MTPKPPSTNTDTQTRPPGNTANSAADDNAQQSTDKDTIDALVLLQKQV
jgi:hypothetical protein